MGKSDEVRNCHNWLRSMLANNWKAFIPEIADYEVRRELLRVGRPRSLQRLDGLQRILTYLPIDTASMRRAAELYKKEPDFFLTLEVCV